MAKEPNVEPAALKKRWTARIQYVDETYDTIEFDEFDELAKAVEGGPDWHFVRWIKVKLSVVGKIGTNKRQGGYPNNDEF